MSGAGLLVASGGGSGMAINTINSQPPVSNNFNFTSPSGSVAIVVTPGSVTFDVSDLGITWNVVTSASNPVTLVPSNGYISKGGTQVTFVLPSTSAVGDTYQIAGYGNLWTITQGSGQSVTLGDVTSTSGASGSVTATQIRDTVTIVCVTANTEYQITSVIGNPSLA